MTIKYSIKIALRALAANRMRSFLTLLGIVIGITAIILVMSVCRGAQELILSQIRGMGSRTIIIEPGREPTGPSDFAEILTDSLKESDVDALLNPANVQGLEEIAPTVMQVMPVSFENETIRTSILGTSELFAIILDLAPAEGSFFTDEDIKQRANVAVIGSEIKRKLFGQSDALGKRIRIKDRSFRVVSVLAPKGIVALFDADNMIAVPYSTAQHYLLGISYFHAFMGQAVNEEIVPRVVNDIKLTLREMHDINDPAKDDFHVTTQADAVSRVSMVTGILTALLVAVAAISLVVGGIGIMNIMLVSVSERTREIGLRKALGATNKNILIQFMLEAVLLTAIGGIIGILLGAFLSFLSSLILSKVVAEGWRFAFPLSAVALGLGVSGFVGLVFGLYPARKAARKSPIEALRYE